MVRRLICVFAALWIAVVPAQAQRFMTVDLDRAIPDHPDAARYEQRLNLLFDQLREEAEEKQRQYLKAAAEAEQFPGLTEPARREQLRNLIGLERAAYNAELDAQSAYREAEDAIQKKIRQDLVGFARPITGASDVDFLLDADAVVHTVGDFDITDDVIRVLRNQTRDRVVPAAGSVRSIDLERLIAAHVESKEADRIYRARFAPLTDNIADLRTELADLDREIRNDGAALAADPLYALESRRVRKAAELRLFEQQYRQLASDERDRLTASIRSEILAYAEILMENQLVDILVSKGDTVIIPDETDGLDITSDVREMMQRERRMD